MAEAIAAGSATGGNTAPQGRAEWHPWQRRLHWLTAGFVFVSIAIALYIVLYPELPETERGTWLWNMQFWLLNIHYILGVLILSMMAIRLVLRLAFGTPPLPDSIPPVQQRFAHLVHILLYVNITYQVAAGLTLINAGGYWIWLRIWEWPVFPRDRAYDLEMILLARDLHFWGAISIGVLLTLHIGAALKHHYVDRDEVLLRMLGKTGSRGATPE